MADELIEILNNDPDVEELNLEYKDIEDLGELLPILSKFQNLKVLSLSDNRMTEVPEDLSCLSSVEDINLNGNMFHDLKNVILALTTMPSLRSLHINLHEEEQVDFIFRNMPNLEMLNDTEVEREEFEGEGEQPEYQDDMEMNENDDRLNQLEQESDQPDNQEQDIEDHQLAQDEHEAEGEDDNDDIVIKPEDLEIIAVLYDSIRELRRRIDQDNDKNLAEDFDRHLKNVMTELNESITTDDPNHVKNANLLKAKFSLYEICFTKAVEYMKSMDEEVGSVFERIQDGQNSIFASFYDLVKKSGGDPDQIRNQLMEKENEANEVIETANALNIRFEKEMQEKENMRRSFDREKAQLRKQIESLELENKKLLDTLIRHSKGEDTENNFASARAGSQVQGHPLFRGTQSKKFNKLAGPVGKTYARTLTLKQVKDVINDMYSQKLKYDQKCVESKLPRETMEQFMYTYLNQRYGLKSLIIEWVAAIINGIKSYLKQDHDVALYGKILKNE